MNKIIRRYVTPDGVDVLQRWLDSLKDKRTNARIRYRLARLEAGHLGDCKPVRQGVYELRLDFGPGYRVYFGLVAGNMILLTCGGTKGTQDRDVEVAIKYLEDFKRRQL